MSLPKPVTEGPRKGNTRTICMKCAHIEYHPPRHRPEPEPEQ
jgi:hypothetical protein